MLELGLTAGHAGETMKRRPAALLRRWPEIVATLTVIAAGLSMLAATLCHDVVWQLWIGRQMLHGTQLYSGIRELNPPLWFWMGAGADRLADLAGIAPESMLIAIVTVAAIASLLAFSAFCGELEDRHRAAILVYAAALIMFMPRFDFGQREQLALISALPWCGLIAGRSDRRRVSPAFAVAIGLGAATGLALKHYFLAAPALLELWLALKLRRAYRPFRPEILAMGIAGGLYAGAIIKLAPDYLSTMVPLIRASYGGYEIPLANMFQGWPPAVWLLIFSALIMAGIIRPRPWPPLATAFFVAAAGFGLAYFVQRKGWEYHAIATTGCLAIGTLILRIERSARLSRAGRRALDMALALPLVFGLLVGSYGNWFGDFTRVMLHDLRPGQTVMVMSADPMQAWPTIEEAGLLWPSRYYSYWMMPAIARAEHDGNISPALAAIDREVVRETAIDLMCNQPARIIVERRPYNYGMNLTGFDYVRHFDRDPLFASVMASYRKGGSNGIFTEYNRVRPTPAPLPQYGCRTLIGRPINTVTDY